MIKSIKVIKENEQNISKDLEGFLKKEMVFRKIRKDAIGKSASNPTWGYTYAIEKGKMKFKGDGLYKEYDCDAPRNAYSEKITSIIAKSLLDTARVPEIDVVEETADEHGIISYKIMDNDAEDMYHIRDLMFYKFKREELEKQKEIFELNDILECIGMQVKDNSNYKQIERSLIHTLLMDAIINNADRHNNNWSLIRNKSTNWYELGIFDHSSCLTDLMQEQRHSTYNGWVGSFVIVNRNNNNTVRRGTVGYEMIKYIRQNYKAYYDEFCDKFSEKLPQILEEIKQENLPIDMRRLENKLNERRNFLNRVKDKEEFEYE